MLTFSQIWLELFGEHVHVGYYDDPREASGQVSASKDWQQSQFDHIDAVLAFAGVKQAQQLVDLGCGYGGTAVYVAQQLSCEAVGVNISPFQVQAANALVARAGLNPRDVKFVVGDALAPELPDASFDLVLSVESAAYMPDKGRFVQQLARLAKPGGTVVLVDFCRGPDEISPRLAKRLKTMDRIFATPGNWHSAEDYKRLMAASGLSVQADGNWTRNVRGFWNVRLYELLLRRSFPKQTLGSRLKEASKRAVRSAWLLLVGGSEVLKMSSGFMLGTQKRAVQGGLDNGDLEYHVIVAKKP